MIMPVRQRCPICREWFMGSDVLGRPCFDCAVEKSRSNEAVDARRHIIRTDAITDGMILAAAAAAYENANTHSGYATDVERSAARSAVRDVMTRLGLYDRFVAESRN